MAGYTVIQEDEKAVDTLTNLKQSPRVPQGADWVVMQALVQAIRYTEDGSTNPTTTTGHLLAAGDQVTLEGDLEAIKVIAAVAGGKVFLSWRNGNP